MFVLGKLLAFIMFAGDDRSQPQRGARERYSTWVFSGLTCIHKNSLKRLARDKHTCVSGLVVSDDDKKVL